MNSIRSNYKSAAQWTNFVSSGKVLGLDSTMLIMDKLPYLRDVLQKNLVTTDLMKNIKELAILLERQLSQQLVIINEEWNIKINDEDSRIISRGSEDFAMFLKLCQSYEDAQEHPPKSEWLFSIRRTKFIEEAQKLILRPFNLLNDDELYAIKMKHPFKYCRKLAVAYTILKELTDSEEPQKLIDVIESMKKDSVTSGQINSRRGKQIMRALEFLAYGIVTNNLESAYKLILRSLMLNTKNYKDLMKSIIDFKRLSTLSSEWSAVRLTDIEKNSFLKRFTSGLPSILTKPLDLKKFTKDNSGRITQKVFKDLDDGVYNEILAWTENNVMAALFGFDNLTIRPDEEFPNESYENQLVDDSDIFRSDGLSSSPFKGIAMMINEALSDVLSGIDKFGKLPEMEPLILPEKCENPKELSPSPISSDSSNDKNSLATFAAYLMTLNPEGDESESET